MERGDVEARPSAPTRVGPFLVAGGLHDTSVLVGLDEHHRAVVLRPLGVPLGDATRARIELLAKAKPTGLVPVVASDLEGPEPWVATELVAGVDLLAAAAAVGPLSPVLVSGVATAVAEVLAHLHKAGLTHGSLHPSALLLTTDGPVVASLGASSATGDAADDVRAWAELVCCAVGADARPTGTGLDVPGLDLDLARLIRDALSSDPAARPSVSGLLKTLLGGFVPPNPTPMVRSVVQRTWLLPSPLVALTRPQRAPKAPLVAAPPERGSRRRGLFRRR